MLCWSRLPHCLKTHVAAQLYMNILGNLKKALIGICVYKTGGIILIGIFKI